MHTTSGFNGDEEEDDKRCSNVSRTGSRMSTFTNWRSYNVSYSSNLKLFSMTALRRAAQQQAFRIPFMAAIICGSVSAGFEAYYNYSGQEATVEDFRFDAETFKLMTTLLGFLVVFRTAHAYARFWTGVSTVHCVMGSWLDATSSLFAFVCSSTEPEAQNNEFKHTVLRLVSLCNAMMFAELEGRPPDVDSQAFSYDLIDAQGIDRRTLKLVSNSNNSVEILFQMIQCLVVRNTPPHSGVLSVPPPILSQVFRDLSGAMVNFHESLKLAHVAFPFPYVCVTETLLLMHWVITPFTISFWVKSSVAAFFFSFIMVFTLWSLQSIAYELDNPFSAANSDLDGRHLQQDFNRRLVSIFILCQQHGLHTPHLSKDAILDLKRLKRYACSGDRMSTKTSQHQEGRRLSVVDNFASIQAKLRRGRSTASDCSDVASKATGSRGVGANQSEQLTTRRSGSQETMGSIDEDGELPWGGSGGRSQGIGDSSAQVSPPVLSRKEVLAKLNDTSQDKKTAAGSQDSRPLASADESEHCAIVVEGESHDGALAPGTRGTSRSPRDSATVDNEPAPRRPGMCISASAPWIYGREVTGASSSQAADEASPSPAGNAESRVWDRVGNV